MTREEALTRLGQNTAHAVGGVLARSFPGEAHSVDTAVLPADARPLVDFPAPFVATSVSYLDGVAGGNVIAMTVEGARRLAAATMGAGRPAADGQATLDEREVSAVSEAMSHMMAAAAGAMTDVLGTEIHTSAPAPLVLGPGESADELCPPSPHAIATELSVLGEPAVLVQLVPDSFTSRMTAGTTELGLDAAVGAAHAPASPSLSGITMRLSAQLGSARMHAGRAVALPAGAIVELDAGADAPVELFVNGVRLATGRLLITDDGEWAVRVEEVARPHAIPMPGDDGPARSPVYSS